MGDSLKKEEQESLNSDSPIRSSFIGKALCNLSGICIGINLTLFSGFLGHAGNPFLAIPTLFIPVFIGNYLGRNKQRSKYFLLVSIIVFILVCLGSFLFAQRMQRNTQKSYEEIGEILQEQKMLGESHKASDGAGEEKNTLVTREWVDRIIQKKKKAREEKF